MWSAEKPKRRGEWWLLDLDFEEPRVRLVDMIGSELAVYLPLDGGWTLISACPEHWRWAGPLVEPVEPSSVEPLPNAVVSDRRQEAKDA